MTVEDKRGSSMDENGVKDQFPVGMRILAVDDDPICLKVLETLLRKCQYHVTITNQAVKALQMLRENRNNYDLVISDVNMPDIDGFKLLELVGLEMDLPVIMLSAHSDTKLVMKGITHGACDYLLKPVRYEELKNIWQHVIRKKVVDPKDHNKSVNQDKAEPGTDEVGQGATSRNTDQDMKTNRKRKDQVEDEEEDGEDNEHDSDDLGTQKKPRVVWSVDLHKKFVAAVNQLGLDKAVPKKILDLMNVDGITRENVASHLQKYRLYLKRISTVASQQANMIAAFGNKDSSYLRIGSLDGFNDFRSLAGPGRYSSSSLSPYPPGRMLSRLNSPATLTLRGITSSGMIQPGPSQNFGNSIDSLAKFHSVGLPANKTSTLFQGVPTSLELNQLQQSKGINPTGDFSPIGKSNAFTAITSIPDARVGLGSSCNTINSVPSNSLLLQGNPQHTQLHTLISNQSSLRMASSSNQDAYDIGVNGSSNLLDHGGCNDGWQHAVQYSSNPMRPLNEQLPLTNLRDNNASSTPQMQSTPIDFRSSGGHSQAVGCSRDADSQSGLISNFVQNMNYTSEQDYSHNLINNYSTINALSSANGIPDPLRHRMCQSSAVSIENSDMPIHGHLNDGASVHQLGDVDRSNANYILDQTKFQDGFIQNNCDSLDELMSTMVKKEQNVSMLMDGDLGFEAYPLGSCM